MWATRNHHSQHVCYTGVILSHSLFSRPLFATRREYSDEGGGFSGWDAASHFILFSLHILRLLWLSSITNFAGLFRF